MIFKQKKVLTGLIGLGVLIAGLSPAITRAVEMIPVTETSAISWISAQERANRDSLENFDTIVDRRDALRALLSRLAKGDEAGALAIAIGAKFKISALKQEAKRLLAITDARHPDQGPTILINPAPKIDLIAGAPHPSNERGTFQQAVLLVTEKGARAAIIAGAHRCASRAYVACDGKTRTCGSREAYRTSDAAHSPATLFHAAHVALIEAWPKALVLSFHGMRTDKKGVRTSLVLSSGIRGIDDETTAASRLRQSMRAALPDEGAVVSCNIPGDRQYEFRRLCGTTNIQGRLVNGDDDVCRQSVTSGSGRFIHLEQDRKVRNHFADDWHDLATNAFLQNYLNAIGLIAPAIE